MACYSLAILGLCGADWPVWGERADVKVSMGPSDGAWEDGYLRELRPRSSDLARPAQIQRVQRLLSVAEAEQSKS